MNTKVTKRLMLFMFMAMVSVAVLIPVYAHAKYDAPSTEEGDKTTQSNKTTTAVNLQHIDGEVDVTVPVTINMVINNDGTFSTPDADDTYIQNRSLMDIYVRSLDITNYQGSSEAEKVTGVQQWKSDVPTSNNTFYVAMAAENKQSTTQEATYDTLAVAGTPITLYTSENDLWKLDQATSTAAKDGGKVTMKLSGAMVHVTDELHTLLDTGIQLQTYTWTIKSTTE